MMLKNIRVVSIIIRIWVKQLLQIFWYILQVIFLCLFFSMVCYIYSLYIFGDCIWMVRFLCLSSCVVMVVVKCLRVQVIVNWCFLVVILLMFFSRILICSLRYFRLILCFLVYLLQVVCFLECIVFWLMKVLMFFFSCGFFRWLCIVCMLLMKNFLLQGKSEDRLFMNWVMKGWLFYQYFGVLLKLKFICCMGKLV